MFNQYITNISDLESYALAEVRRITADHPDYDASHGSVYYNVRSPSVATFVNHHENNKTLNMIKSIDDVSASIFDDIDVFIWLNHDIDSPADMIFVANDSTIIYASDVIHVDFIEDADGAPIVMIMDENSNIWYGHNDQFRASSKTEENEGFYGNYTIAVTNNI